jgi:archaellum component FlaC
MASTKDNQRKIEQIERDVVKLGTDVAVVKNDIKTIKDNHLAHIEKNMQKLDYRMWWVLGLLVASVVSPFLPFIKGLW